MHTLHFPIRIFYLFVFENPTSCACCQQRWHWISCNPLLCNHMYIYNRMQKNISYYSLLSLNSHMMFRVRWIDTYLHLVMGIFYLLILTNILNRNYIKLNMCIITQIIPASHKRLFLLRISHISVLFLVLLVPNISVHLFVFRWTCFLFLFFLFFFFFLLFLFIRCGFALMIYFSLYFDTCPCLWTEWWSSQCSSRCIWTWWVCRCSRLYVSCCFKKIIYIYVCMYVCLVLIWPKPKKQDEIQWNISMSWTYVLLEKHIYFTSWDPHHNMSRCIFGQTFFLIFWTCVSCVINVNLIVVGSNMLFVCTKFIDCCSPFVVSCRVCCKGIIYFGYNMKHIQ